MSDAKVPKQTYAEWQLDLLAGQMKAAGGDARWRGKTAFDAYVNDVLVNSVERVDDVFVMLDFSLSNGALERLQIRPKINKYYMPSPYRGMVRVRLGKDPSHSLSSEHFGARLALYADVRAQGAAALTGAEANVTTFLGGAPAAATPRSVATPTIRSDGSGYVAMSVSQAKKWKRSKADLAALLAGGDDACIVETSVGAVLSLGTPDALHLVARKDGLLLIRVVHSEEDDDDALTKLFASIRGTKFKAIDGILKVSEPWVAFASEQTGTKALKSDEAHLPLALPKGNYSVAYKLETSDQAEFQVVRLARKP